MSGLVSVVIPVFNRDQYLYECIISITEQTYQNWELILVDDGSIDNSIQMAQEFAKKDPRILAIQRERQPKGAPTCRNIGFSYAKGEFIQFFDSDDLMLPELLEDKVKAISVSNKIDFVVSKMADLNEEGIVRYPSYSLESDDPFLDMAKSDLSYLTPGPLFKKAFLEKFDKGFDERLARHQEWEYYCRLLSANPNIVMIDKVHCLRRHHPDSIKAKSEKSGNLPYRKSKMKAMKCLNENTYFRFVKAFYLIFKPYGMTTLKVAIYQMNLSMVFQVIFWLVRFKLSYILNREN